MDISFEIACNIVAYGKYSQPINGDYRICNYCRASNLQFSVRYEDYDLCYECCKLINDKIKKKNKTNNELSNNELSTNLQNMIMKPEPMTFMEKYIKSKKLTLKETRPFPKPHLDVFNKETERIRVEDRINDKINNMV
jgi:hypothetical protein